MNTCKECEHSEPPRNPEWQDSIYWMNHGFHYDLKAQAIQAQNPCFTPKPKEPERACKTCRYSRTNNGTGKDCDTFRGVPLHSCYNHKDWQPIEQPKPTEKITDRLCNVLPDFPLYQPLKKAKENKMKIGIFNFTVRRYVMACTLYATAKIAILLNPLICQVWSLVPIWDGTGSADKTMFRVILPWLLTIISIGIVVAAIYAYNKATAWLFGESK